MRLRGVYLLVVAASVAAVLTVAGPASAATPDPACGTTLITSFTLTGDINCTGYAGSALYIGQAGITINLNGHTITGASGYDVINNTVGITSGYDGLTVENGTLVVQGSGTGIDNSNGGDGVVVSNMTIEGGFFQIDLEYSTGDVVTGSTLTDAGIVGVYLWRDTGTLVNDNTINQPGLDGIFEQYGQGETMSGNTLTGSQAFDTGICISSSAGTSVSGNTIESFGVSGITDALCAGQETGVGRLGATAGHLNPNGASAGLMITGNTVGAANPAGGNGVGINLFAEGGDVIQGNYVRNSKYYGISDSNSNNAVYSGNVLTSNGNNSVLGVTGDSNFYLTPNGYGPVTVVNNYSRLAGMDGYWIFQPYNNGADIPTPPYSVITGNAATYNRRNGIFVNGADGATITHNTAYQNGGNGDGDGFYFYDPAQAVITNNTATLNEMEGFYFAQASGAYAPESFANNTATYNGDYGFFSHDAVPGSGNSASNNGAGSCYLVAGCS